MPQLLIGFISFLACFLYFDLTFLASFIISFVIMLFAFSNGSSSGGGGGGGGGLSFPVRTVGAGLAGYVVGKAIGRL